MRYSLLLNLICTLGVQIALFSPVAVAESVFFLWDKAQVEGGANAPLRLEVDEEGTGARLILQHRKAWNAVRIPGALDLEQRNLLKFRVKFSSENPKLNDFQVILADSQGRLYASRFASHATRVGDEVEFSWDVANEPDQDQGADLSDLKEVRLKFDFESIPANEEQVIQVRDLRMESGKTVASGDVDRFAEWKDFIANYRVDESEGSRFLQPPVSGRIAAPITLVKNQQALARIVLSEGASEPENKAAEELQLWISRITGAEVPIKKTSEGDGATVFLGEAFAKDHFRDDLKSLAGTDGFAVRTKGNEIFIFGAEPKGTLNGAFAFLENNSDLIWARPHPDFGSVYSHSADFTAVWADALEKPSTFYRGWLPNLGGGIDFTQWANRNRNNYVGGLAQQQFLWGDRVEFGGGHNLQTFIPKDDKRYFPIVNGEKPEKLSIWKHQICLSVPDLATTYADNVVNYIKEKSPQGLRVFNIKIEDNWGVCECEKCLAPLALPDGRLVKNDDPAFRSTQFYTFLNDVTKKVNAVFPGLQIQTYAYFYTAIPPLVSLDENIYVLFCPYVRKDHRTPLYSPINREWWRRLTEWARITPNIVMREYYGIFNEGRPLAEVVAADVRADLDLGVRNFVAEINPDFLRVWSDGKLRGGEDEFDLSAMEYWIINRIYWQAQGNVEDLRKYYLTRTFREAAPQMEKFFGLVRKGWFEHIRPPSTWGKSPEIWKATIVSKGHLDAMQEVLDKALEAAGNPSSRIMISKIRDRFLREVGRLPVSGKVDVNNLTPEQFLAYGWRAPNKLDVAYATHVEHKGKSLPAVRFISHERSRGKAVFGTLFSSDREGLSFRFKVAPVRGVTSVEDLPLLRISDANGEETASVEAYQPSESDPHSWEFAWTPRGVNAKGQPLDLKKLTRLQLVAQGNGEGVQELILTDLGVN